MGNDELERAYKSHQRAGKVLIAVLCLDIVVVLAEAVIRILGK